MKKQIWKFPLFTQDNPLVIQKVTHLQFPGEAEILSIKLQDDRPFLWAIVEPGKPANPRAIHAVCTGEERGILIDNHLFLDTVILPTGFVTHFF